MKRGLILIPAYGRSYKSARAAVADFQANKDFIAMDIYHQGYTSKRELQDEANKTGDTIFLEFRYGNNLTRVTCITIKPEVQDD